MKKSLQIMLWICIGVSCINVVWMTLSFYELSNVYNWITGSSSDFIMKFLFYGTFVSFLSHILVFSSLIRTLAAGDRMIVSGSLLLLMGLLSFVSLYLHWGGLIDIVNEFPKGLEINFEVQGLKVAIVLQSAMYIYSIIYFFRLLRTAYSPTPKSTGIPLLN
jgi:hypothetical protein